MEVRRLPFSIFERSRFAVLVVGVGLTLIVGTLDWVTGPNLDFALFYLVPVCFVTWHAGARLGYLASLVAAISLLLADRLTGAKSADSLVAIWNLVMRLGFFCASVLVLNGWRQLQLRLTAVVDERTAALRQLAVQLSTTEDAERRKLAYDMHDAISQTLSIIKINLDSAQIEAADPTRETAGPLQSRLTNAGAMVDNVIKQTRTLMFDLHPAMLDDLGLAPTLQWYATEFSQRTGTELLASEQGERRLLPVAMTNYLFRAIKELLNNAVKHGRAKEIIVTLHWDTDTVRVVVDDDGHGFDVDSARTSSARRGLGLAGIDERVRSMGGSVVVESNSGQGSRIILEVPIPAPTEKAVAEKASDSAVLETAHAAESAHR